MLCVGEYCLSRDPLGSIRRRDICADFLQGEITCSPAAHPLARLVGMPVASSGHEHAVIVNPLSIVQIF